MLWAAYEQVEVGRVRHNPRARLTDLVSLLRFSLHADDEVVPYAEKVRQHYAGWLASKNTQASSLPLNSGGGSTTWRP